MTVPTQPLRDEHRELLPRVADLREVGDLAGDASADDLAPRLRGAASFLHDHLLRHARAEEAALYPAIERLTGCPELTGTMRRDHAEIARLSAELEAVGLSSGTAGFGPETRRRLRELLYGLHAIVALHFAKEEEVYLPLLDARLTPDEAAQLFARLEAAAAAG